jgi:hypothetical protein
VSNRWAVKDNVGELGAGEYKGATDRILTEQKNVRTTNERDLGGHGSHVVGLRVEWLGEM